MPANLTEFYDAQDALVVFVNYCHKGRGEFIRNFLDCRFGSSREYLYLEGSSLSSGAGLAEYIAAEKKAFRISLPQSRRLVFCFYLSVNDMSQEWLDRLQEVAQEIDLLFPALGGGHHYYITCFQYEVGRMLGERREEILGLLEQFGRKQFSFYHVQYLLYKPMADELDSQEQAVVQLLHMWSRADYQKAVNPFEPETMGQLRIVAFADYLEAEAEECQLQMKAINSWLCQEADPDLSNLFWQAISGAMERTIRLNGAISRFEELSGLYPLRVTDYIKHFWGKYERVVDDGPGSYLQKRKREYVQDICQELLDSAEFTSLHRAIREELHYPDLVRLQIMLADDSFAEEFLTRMKSKENTEDEEVQGFLKEWYCRLKVSLESVIPDLEREKAKMEQEMERQRIRLEKAGRYKNLKDCLARMYEEVRFMTPVDVLPNGIDTFLLVAGKCSINWRLEGYEASGVDAVYSYPAIAPAEIVMIKEASYIDLAGTEAGEELRRIFH